jgi:outer membrane protein, heavy metal efflux system
MKFPAVSLLFVSVSLFAAEPPLDPEALVAEIAQTHPELQFYTAELEAAKADLKLAAMRPAPELSVEAGRKRVRDMSGALAGEGTAWSVSLAQTFEWPGRLALRKAIANRDVALAELGLAKFDATLRGRIRQLSFDLYAAEQNSEAAAEVASRFLALKETFLARDPSALTPLLETRVIEAQELLLRRRATEAELAARAARTELNQLRGRPVDESVRVSRGSLALAEPPPAEELLTAAQAHDFDFLAKKIELEQQGFAVELARHERRPAVTLAPFVSRESAGERETTIGVGVTVPLSSRTRAGVDGASARRRQAEAALTMAQRDLERAVIHAADTLRAKRAEVLSWAPDSVQRFREAAALADRHYRLGAVPLSTYVELQTAYLDAVESLLETEREALEAAVKLHALTGRDVLSGGTKK